MFGVVYEILESSCKNYMYVVVVHFVVGMEKLVLLVSTTIFLGSGRRSIMCMLQPSAPLHVGDEEIGWIQMMGVVFRVG